ncbi:MAG: hypothetical protein L3J79_07705, partial [Candidatus Marinimicrobia bacterium]|nr:hypothetical protein [Candidatus Neomarinimicrobiota bacterium]
QRISVQQILRMQPFIKGQEAELAQQIKRISRVGENSKLQAYYKKKGISKDMYVIVNANGSTTEYPLDRIENHMRALGDFNHQVDGISLFNKS